MRTFRGSGGVAGRLNGAVQALVEVDKRLRTPQPEAQRFARNHLSGALQQRQQHLQRLLLNRQPHPILHKRMGARVHRKPTKPKHRLSHDAAFPFCRQDKRSDLTLRAPEAANALF